MKAQVAYRFLNPFEHTEVFEVKVKRKHRSCYSNQNLDRNKAAFVDVVREALDSAVEELKAAGVTGRVVWVYSGFMSGFLFDKLRQMESCSLVKQQKGTVCWTIQLGENHDS
jgi:ferric iron reductase protein FhuF